MPTEKGYFAVIPPEVRYCADLPDGAKLLYGEITALCNWKGYCWATNRYFADLYGKTTRTVIRWIQDLEERAFIAVERDAAEGRPRQISIVQGGDKNVTGGEMRDGKGVTKMSLTHDKNVTHININNKRNNTESRGDIADVFHAWKTALKHPNAKLDPKRSARIAARLAEGFTVEELKKVPQGVLCSPYHLGQNETKTKYDGIDTVYRDRAQVEKFIELADRCAPKPVPEGYVDQAAWYHETFIAPQLRKREEDRRSYGGA